MVTEKTSVSAPDTSEIREANSCVALGAGVGALGLGSALLSGAVCPICVVVAPGLIGAGLLKRYKILKRKMNGGSHD